MPTVSVLMVFHRDTPFLRPAIASVLGQTWRDLELVLVDNGTGLSAVSLGDLGRDPRVRWVRLPDNAGIAGGHNAGVAAAQGDFVALLDYDDLMMPRRLESQVAGLRSDTRVGLIASLAEAIDEHDRVLGREFALVNPDEQLRYSQFAAPFFTPACTGRREVFIEAPYRGAFLFAADFDFITRVSERWRLAAVPEVLCRYRHHGGQTTVQRAGRIAAERCAVRLITARRRAGQPEGDELVPADLAAAASPAAAARACAARCLAEGFAVLAAYHARRSLAEERTPVSSWSATRLFARSLRLAPAAERAAVARMFFTGPVRALGLRPG